MRYHPTEIRLSPEDQAKLEQVVRAGTSEQRQVLRARIVLLAAAGHGTEEIAEILAVRAATVSKWRVRYGRHGVAGLADATRSGRPRQYDQTTEKRILMQLDQPTPDGYSGWTGPLLAAALGDVSDDGVWRVLRRYHIRLDRQRSWCLSTDPAFGTKAADIIGLYLDPPTNAVVLAVDEKPSIQALERSHGLVRRGRHGIVHGQTSTYRRHGTTTLFAALNVRDGRVKVRHSQRRRRREFLAFMNEVVAEYPPDLPIHVILDNLSTHKPKNDRWLARHKNVHFHYTPTHASWLNQIEIWFGMLSKAALRHLSFTSPRQIRCTIDRYVASYNRSAKPFQWKKAVVHPAPLRTRYADFCK